MPQVMEGPRDNLFVAHASTVGKRLLEQLRSASRIAFAPTDFAQAYARDRDLPRVIGPRADRQRLLDQGSRTTVVAVHAGEPAEAHQWDAPQTEFAELAEYRQAFGEADARGVVVPMRERAIAHRPEHHCNAPDVADLFEDRPRLAHRSARHVRIVERS